jgi:Phage integrase family
VTSGETRSVLESLAVALTRTGVDGLSFSDRQIARSSRLVADGPDGSVLFSLPIFQHWFAAQAILAGDVPAAEVVADVLSFNRWRWAAAVAALSAPGAEAVEDLLGTWVAGNPGAAAWVINEAFSGHRDWRTEGDEDLDAETSGARLLRALRTWTKSLGPLADGVLPSPVVQGPVGLGVTVSGHRIDVAFSTSRPAADYVTEVPPGVHPLLPVPVPDWLPLTVPVLRVLEVCRGERTTGPLVLRPVSGKPIDRRDVYRMVQRIAKAARIPRHISPHSLRHAAITNALDAGVPLRDAQILARHADPRTTEHYDRARGNLDRHGVHFLTAYVAGV